MESACVTARDSETEGGREWWRGRGRGRCRDKDMKSGQRKRQGCCQRTVQLCKVKVMHEHAHACTPACLCGVKNKKRCSRDLIACPPPHTRHHHRHHTHTYTNIPTHTHAICFGRPLLKSTILRTLYLTIELVSRWTVSASRAMARCNSYIRVPENVRV